MIIDLPPEPVANPVTLMELQWHHCRWPIGDPQSPDFMFCGANKLDGHPYCGRHCGAAYSRHVTVGRAALELQARRMAKMRRAKAA